MKLYTIAHTKKTAAGNHSVISVIPYNPNMYTYLKNRLTEQRVKRHLKAVIQAEVMRHEADKLPMLNFVVNETVDQANDPMTSGQALCFHLLNIEI